MSADSVLTFLKSGVAICAIGGIQLCFRPPDSAFSSASLTSLLDVLIFNDRNYVTLHSDSFWSDLPEEAMVHFFFFFFQTGKHCMVVLNFTMIYGVGSVL